MEKIKEVKYIAFNDEKDKLIEGMFSVLEIVEGSHIKIETSKNVLTIPWHKIQKIKEPIKELD